MRTDKIIKYDVREILINLICSENCSKYSLLIAVKIKEGSIIIMQLLTKYIDQKNWRKSDLSKEVDYIRAFYPDIEEVKNKLRHGEIIACSIRLYQIDNQ